MGSERPLGDAVVLPQQHLIRLPAHHLHAVLTPRRVEHSEGHDGQRDPVPGLVLCSLPRRPERYTNAVTRARLQLLHTHAAAQRWRSLWRHLFDDAVEVRSDGRGRCRRHRHRLHAFKVHDGDGAAVVRGLHCEGSGQVAEAPAGPAPQREHVDGVATAAALPVRVGAVAAVRSDRNCY